MNSVVHFEIPATDLQRAQDFYGAVFGWKMMPFDAEQAMTSTTDTDDKGMPTTPGAINGSFYKAEGRGPSIVVDVPNIDSHMEVIEQHGGRLVDLPTTIPNMGVYARFEDPEGNLIGLWQSL
ncbi:MAG: VOC family protein [Dehalococcoidia bacterium]|nr:VOC family protein [Dehalococcoidia bacterium]